MTETRDVLQQRHGPRYRWRVLFTVMIGTVASIMSATIVNVAVPDMIRVFTLGQERAQWMSAGFMAAMTISMLMPRRGACVHRADGGLRHLHGAGGRDFDRRRAGQGPQGHAASASRRRH